MYKYQIYGSDNRLIKEYRQTKTKSSDGAINTCGDAEVCTASEIATRITELQGSPLKNINQLLRSLFWAHIFPFLVEDTKAKLFNSSSKNDFVAPTL